MAYVNDGDFLNSYQKNRVKSKRIFCSHLENKKSPLSYSKLVKSIRLFKNEYYDLAYCNELMDIPLFSRLKKKGKIGALICHLRLPPPNPQILKKKNQISYSISEVNCFFAGTSALKTKYVEFGIPESKITVIPNAFNFDQSVLSKKASDDFRIGFIGRITPEKGLVELVEAYFKLKIPNKKLIIGGSAETSSQKNYLETIQQRIKESGQENRIEFLGVITDLAVFYSSIDLCVFPSTWDEPFGRVLVESIIHDTPIIARSVGSVKEILDDKSNLITFDTDEQLITQIENFEAIEKEYPLVKLKESMKARFDIATIVQKIQTEFERVNNE